MNGMLAVKERKMELGSSSLPTSGASPSNDSLNGLKFGKKIYLGDVGVGISAKTGTPAASSSVANVVVVAAAPRKGRGLVQGKPPRCLVEGCKVDLTGAKAYYCKHKVCGMHSKSPKVIVNGLEQRFCQQCSRFHQLPEFDQGKRSCRRRLAGHNERRRKPSLESLTSRYERLPSSFHAESKVAGFLMDFSHRRSVGRDIWPTVRAGGERVPSNRSPAVGKSLPNLGQGNLEARSASDSSHSSQPCLQSSLSRTSFPSSEIPVKETFMGISNSGGALSLLPTRPWGPRNRNSVVAADNFAKEEVRMAQFSQGVTANNFMSNAWGYKNQETRSSSHGVQCELGGTRAGCRVCQ